MTTSSRVCRLISASLIVACFSASSLVFAEPKTPSDRWLSAAKLISEMEGHVGQTLLAIEYARAKKQTAKQTYLYAKLRKMVGHVQASRAVENELLVQGNPTQGLGEEGLDVVKAHAEAVRLIAKEIRANGGDGESTDSRVVREAPPADTTLNQVGQSSILNNLGSLVDPWPGPRPPPASPFQVVNE